MCEHQESYELRTHFQFVLVCQGLTSCLIQMLGILVYSSTSTQAIAGADYGFMRSAPVSGVAPTCGDAWL